jgi:hypothetical protein
VTSDGDLLFQGLCRNLRRGGRGQPQMGVLWDWLLERDSDSVVLLRDKRLRLVVYIQEGEFSLYPILSRPFASGRYTPDQLIGWVHYEDYGVQWGQERFVGYVRAALSECLGEKIK